MYLFFTMPKCSRCKVNKGILDNKNFQYTEVQINDTPESKELCAKYNVFIGGTLVDSETGKHLDVKAV